MVGISSLSGPIPYGTSGQGYPLFLMSQGFSHCMRDSPIVWGIPRQSESESLLSVSPRCFIDWSAFSRSWRSLSISSLDWIDWSALSLSRFSKASRSSWLSESWGKRNQKPFFQNHLWMYSFFPEVPSFFKSWIKIKAYFKHNFPTSNFSMTYVKQGKFFHKCYYMEWHCIHYGFIIICLTSTVPWII